MAVVSNGIIHSSMHLLSKYTEVGPIYMRQLVNSARNISDKTIIVWIRMNLAYKMKGLIAKLKAINMFGRGISSITNEIWFFFSDFLMLNFWIKNQLNNASFICKTNLLVTRVYQNKLTNNTLVFLPRNFHWFSVVQNWLYIRKFNSHLSVFKFLILIFSCLKNTSSMSAKSKLIFAILVCWKYPVSTRVCVKNKPQYLLYISIKMITSFGRNSELSFWLM